MRHIVHDEPPATLRAALRAQPNPANPRLAWKHFDHSEVRDQLYLLQHGLCAYCERVLAAGPGGSSIDHVFPKGSDCRGTFKYENMLLCCTDTKTCNEQKRGNYFTGFLSPLLPTAPAAYRYDASGTIEPADPSTKADAKRTIEILNLKAPHLVTEREAYFESLSKSIADMADQLDAVAALLAAEFQPLNDKPFISAKLQLFAVPVAEAP